MTPRRFFAGSLVLSGLTGWCWCSHDETDPARPPSLPAVMASPASPDTDADGNRAEQEYRFRTSQCRHWRHLMLGTR